MKLNFECINCNINQVTKVAKVLGYDRETTEKVMREELAYLSKADYEQSNAEVMGGTWGVLTQHAGQKDIYRTLKSYYNHQVMNMEEEILEMIGNGENKFNLALRVAITGNLIDFAAKSEFNPEIVKDNIRKIKNKQLGIDHSRDLHERLKNGKKLLYIGDNCGEICLDKIFIACIKEEFPQLKITFGVRGEAILNDVILEDAHMVGMDQAADIIENGDNCPGTVLSRVSPEYRSCYEEADVIIAKGLGNFESLSEEKKEIFFLFMAKCQTSAERVGVEIQSLVCMKNAG